VRWLTDTLTLYAQVFRRGAVLALRNWGVGFLVVVYVGVLSLVAVLVAPLGIVGGFLVYLALVACVSSWLALAGEVIRTGRVKLADVPASFGAYLNDLLVVGFIVWGLQLIGGILAAVAPFVAIVFGLATAVFLNAVPELIYLGRRAPAELLVESYRFIGENWIEWFPANVLLFGTVLAAQAILPAGPFGLLGAAGVGLVLYFATIVRGLLFLELAGSTRRSREFRRRVAR